MRIFLLNRTQTEVRAFCYFPLNLKSSNQEDDHIEKTINTSNCIPYVMLGLTGLLSAGCLNQCYCSMLNKQVNSEFQKYTYNAMDLFSPTFAWAFSGLFFKQIINVKDHYNQILRELDRRIEYLYFSAKRKN